MIHKYINEHFQDYFYNKLLRKQSNYDETCWLPNFTLQTLRNKLHLVFSLSMDVKGMLNKFN